MDIVRCQMFCLAFLALEYILSSLSKKRGTTYHIWALLADSDFKTKQGSIQSKWLELFCRIFTLYCLPTMWLLVSYGMSTLLFPPPQSIHVWNWRTHRMVWVRRDLKDHLVVPPIMGRDMFHETRLLKAPAIKLLPLTFLFFLFSSVSLQSFLQILKGQKATDLSPTIHIFFCVCLQTEG